MGIHMHALVTGFIHYELVVIDLLLPNMSNYIKYILFQFKYRHVSIVLGQT